MVTGASVSLPERQPAGPLSAMQAGGPASAAVVCVGGEKNKQTKQNKLTGTRNPAGEKKSLLNSQQVAVWSHRLGLNSGSNRRTTVAEQVDESDAAAPSAGGSLWPKESFNYSLIISQMCKVGK